MTYRNENQYGVGEALGDVVGTAAIFGVTSAGIKAYKNHKARTGNSQEALYLALLTARRWWLWAAAVIFLGFASVIACWGMIWLHVIIPSRHGDLTNYTPETGTARFAIETVVAYTLSWCVIWTIYCRHIDSGLHKRGWVYRLFTPLYKATMRVPSFFLYLSIPMFLIFI